MSSNSDDAGVLFLAFEIASDESGCLDPIHYRHAKVHQNDLILHAILVGSLYLVEGLLAVNAEVYLVLCIDANVLQNRFHRRQAELLIVYHQETALGILGILVVQCESLIQVHLLRCFCLLWSCFNLFNIVHFPRILGSKY